MRAVCIIPVIAVLLAMGTSKVPFDKALITFRFDDAYTSQVAALDLLAGERMKATVYAITGYVETPSYMTWKDLERLNSLGHEIGSHSVDHESMIFMSAGALDSQFRKSREMLEKKGISAVSFAWPYGFFSPFFNGRVRRFYDNAVDYPLGSIGEMNYRNGDPYKIKCVVARSVDEFEVLMKRAVKTGGWMVVCFHRIGDGRGKFFVSMKDFSGMVKIAAGYREKGLVEIVTVSEGAEKMTGKVPRD